MGPELINSSGITAQVVRDDGGKVIKKGQLRRWKEGWGWMAGKTFVTVGSKVHKLNPGELRRELGWGSYHRGRRIWTILMDGGLEYEEHMEIERGSEVIDETR